jgi:hypothetical protein
MMPLGTYWLEDIGGPSTLEAIGWMVMDNPDSITICMDQNPESKGLRFILSIPKCAILEMARLCKFGDTYDREGTPVPPKSLVSEACSL